MSAYGDLTGCHLIPGRDDVVVLFLSKNTFGHGYVVAPTAVTVDGFVVASVAALAAAVATKRLGGTARGEEDGADVNGYRRCAGVDLCTRDP